MSEFVEQANQAWRDAYPPGEPGFAEWREAVTTMHAQYPVPDDAVITEVDAGGVPCLWVSAPGVATDKAAIHFHSGGYVMGSAHNYREFAYRLSKALDARVLVVDFRLAPEHLYPAALEDAQAAFRWLATQVEPGRIVSAGDSAGGGLALALQMSLRDNGEPTAGAIALFSPWADLAAEGASYDEFPDDPVVSRPFALANCELYLSGADPHTVPYASPVSGAFQDLPPIFAVVGAHEALRDDSVRIVEQARAAGGDAELLQIDHVPHIFTIFPFLPEAADALAAAGAFVGKRI
jgi:epsilon-lactone hydrolase